MVQTGTGLNSQAWEGEARRKSRTRLRIPAKVGLELVASILIG
jgi:hypothetical protein